MAITWRDISAPDFSSANNMMQQASANMTSGLQTLTNLANEQVQKNQAQLQKTKDTNTYALMDYIRQVDNMEDYQNLNINDLAARVGGVDNVNQDKLLEALHNQDNIILDNEGKILSNEQADFNLKAAKLKEDERKAKLGAEGQAVDFTSNFIQNNPDATEREVKQNALSYGKQIGLTGQDLNNFVTAANNYAKDEKQLTSGETYLGNQIVNNANNKHKMTMDYINAQMKQYDEMEQMLNPQFFAKPNTSAGNLSMKLKELMELYPQGKFWNYSDEDSGQGIQLANSLQKQIDAFKERQKEKGFDNIPDTVIIDAMNRGIERDKDYFGGDEAHFPDFGVNLQRSFDEWQQTTKRKLEIQEGRKRFSEQAELAAQEHDDAIKYSVEFMDNERKLRQYFLEGGVPEGEVTPELVNQTTNAVDDLYDSMISKEYNEEGDVSEYDANVEALSQVLSASAIADQLESKGATPDQIQDVTDRVNALHAAQNTPTQLGYKYVTDKADDITKLLDKKTPKAEKTAIFKQLKADGVTLENLDNFAVLNQFQEGSLAGDEVAGADARAAEKMQYLQDQFMADTNELKFTYEDAVNTTVPDVRAKQEFIDNYQLPKRRGLMESNLTGSPETREVARKIAAEEEWNRIQGNTQATNNSVATTDPRTMSNNRPDYQYQSNIVDNATLQFESDRLDGVDRANVATETQSMLRDLQAMESTNKAKADEMVQEMSQGQRENYELYKLRMAQIEEQSLSDEQAEEVIANDAILRRLEEEAAKQDQEFTDATDELTGATEVPYQFDSQLDALLNRTNQRSPTYSPASQMADDMSDVVNTRNQFNDRITGRDRAPEGSSSVARNRNAGQQLQDTADKYFREQAELENRIRQDNFERDRDRQLSDEALAKAIEDDIREQNREQEMSREMSRRARREEELANAIPASIARPEPVKPELNYDKPEFESDYSMEERLAQDITGNVIDAENSAKAIDNVMGELERLEGKEGGDAQRPDLKTLPMGVLESTAKELGMEGEPPAKIAKAYLSVTDNHLSEELEGYAEAPVEMKTFLLDMTYNMGKNSLTDKGKFPKLKRALANGDYEEVVFQTLDSAQTKTQGVNEVKPSKGHARRRAEQVNKSGLVDIKYVEQKSDGEIIYYDPKGKVVYRFGKGKGMAAGSKAGRMAVY